MSSGNSALEEIARRAAGVAGVRELFARDENRAAKYTLDACGLHVDFSRQLIDDDLASACRSLCDEVDLSGFVNDMFAGVAVNHTEGRSVLHVALRARGDESAEARWAAEQIERAMVLATGVRSGAVAAPGGKKFAAIVNIGIGGSDLGPAMVTRALRRFHDGPVVRFVSNIDPADLDAAIADLDPATTLFVVSSKTFTTQETMHNALRARTWVGPKWSQHFVAATADPGAAQRWGIDPDRILQFADWVGGRFSVSSVIGFPVMCAIGAERFGEFLDGLHDIDDHFRFAPWEKNLPVQHGLTWWVNAVVRKWAAVAVVPYARDLDRFPAHLQQLVMESNGKGVTRNGNHVAHPTSPVVFGEAGTNGQHAFFQMLHQGTAVIPVDFISAVEPMGSDPSAHDMLVANMLAQSDALAMGRSLGETEAATGAPDPHRAFPGNRPSTVIFMDRLDPRHLGALLGMYEHSTVVQGHLMDVNSFDQWGVELGKHVAHAVLAHDERHLHSDDRAPLVMTQPLWDWYRSRHL